MSTIREAFGSIANAIRSANGMSDAVYTPSEMVPAIMSLGGGVK